MIIINGLVKFSNNNVHDLINFENNFYQFIIVKESSAIEISQNKVCTFFKTETLETIPYPFCFFQYINNERLDESTNHKNFSVTFQFNEITTHQIPYCVTNIPIANCKWISQLTFNGIVPLDVNKRYIKYYDNNSDIESLGINQSTLCICTDEMKYTEPAEANL